MDSGVDTTQRIVIGVAVFLGIAIFLVIGYSLYTKAKRAEGELANKEALDAQTRSNVSDASISLTGESRNTTNFSYDGLIQKKDDVATTTNFEIVNETTPIPEEVYPEEEPVPPEETYYEPAPKPKPVYVDPDRPLTAEEIAAIRRLPIDNSPSGNLQTTLETESQGQYRARY
jgi:hypothetical protein